MDKEQIIEKIKREEEFLYNEFIALRNEFGREHEYTKYASAQWNAVSTLLEQIENAEI